MFSLPNFNGKLFKKGQIVAVALSGGEDSVCLFHFLLSSADELGVKVKAINVDHSIRGENSVADSEFVRNLCLSSGTELFFRKVDCPKYSEENGVSTEEAARILRYKVFYEAINAGFCDAVVTAHHLSDNAETVLLNLFRGAANLKGMDETSQDGKILRPMLNVRKADVSAYVKDNGLKFVTDETNSDENYTRNFLRIKVLPLLKEKFPKVEEAIGRFTETEKKENEYLNALAEEYVIKSGGEVSVSCDCPIPLLSRAAAIAMRSVGIVKDYEKRHIDLLIGLKDKNNGTAIDLPFSVKAVKDYGKITLYKDEKEKPFDDFPFGEGEYTVGDKILKVKIAEKMENERGTLFVDGDKIPRTAKIRTRRDGDTFLKFGGGRKKLKDYLIDVKVPSRERDGLLLLADGKEVLIIFGIEISDSVKVDKRTAKVLKCNIYNVGEDK